MDPHLQSIRAQIQEASATRRPLRIRGSGSKDFYGHPQMAHQALELGGYSGIVNYEPSELYVSVRAGTPLATVEAELARHQQCLAFEPPHFHGQSGTCGGMVAAGLSGPARASVGSVRDYVLGVQMLNSQGELLTFGGQVMKNVAGYDISRLMAGSLGILGVLTEISLKVLPVAPATATLVFEADQATALQQLNRWGGMPLPLNASCWVRDDTAPGRPELLFVRLRGAVAAVDSASRLMLQSLNGRLMNAQQAEADWQKCRDHHLPFFQAPQSHTKEGSPVLWRMSVPQSAPPLNVPGEQLIEWHGAQRWLWAPWSAWDQIQQACAQAGGSASVFRDPAGVHTRCRFAPLDPVMQGIHERLQAEFDPQHIFNPGRMYPSLSTGKRDAN